MIKAHAREVWGHAPPDKFWISNLLRSFLVLDVLLLNLVVVFEARGIKGVTPFWVAEATKQLVICVRSKKISALILIVYHHLWLQREQCMNKKFALIPSLDASLIIRARRLCAHGILDTGMS